MPKPKFQVPAISSKTIGASTLKNYKSMLNKLVLFGFRNIDEIIANPEKVVEAVDSIVESAEECEEHNSVSTCRCAQCASRYAKRQLYSAIFYALADTEFIKTKNPLYEAFQKVKQNYNSH